VAKHNAARQTGRASEAAHGPAEQPAPRTLRSVRGKAADDASGGALALDRLIHERLRLGILSALAVNESLTFNDLKKLMRTTDGNLSVHARKLEEAGYVACDKSFDGRVPRTEYSITPTGRRAFERYLNHLEALIRASRER
jgi:DNA-binding MarR family transcriptional regulator